jgi:hypothetical protein
MVPVAERSAMGGAMACHGACGGGRRSLRDISAMLAETGHLNEHGRMFNHSWIKAMFES